MYRVVWGYIGTYRSYIRITEKWKLLIMIEGLGKHRASYWRRTATYWRHAGTAVRFVPAGFRGFGGLGV